MVFFSFDANEALILLKPLAIFIAAMTMYGIFIFKFYRYIGKRDLIALNLNKYNTFEHAVLKRSLSIFFYIIEYIFFVPFLTFFWFAVFVVLIGFLSRSVDITNVLLVSMALIGTIRFAAYYNEGLSKDLAKMIPFALLGVFLIDISFFSVQGTIEVLKQITDHVPTLIYYFIFIIVLEFVLKIWEAIRKPKPEVPED